MRIKPLDRVIVIVMLVAIIASFALFVSASSFYTSTLLLARKTGFTGSFRKYDCAGEIYLQFDGAGSEGNNLMNVVELIERILIFDTSRGYRYVGRSVNETWTDCGNTKYAFHFYNNGTTDWESDAVYMSSN